MTLVWTVAVIVTALALTALGIAAVVVAIRILPRLLSGDFSFPDRRAYPYWMKWSGCFVALHSSDSYSKRCNLFLSCQREMPNSQWGDTGSDCAVGRRHP
jgi:hypothetical protein